MLADSSAADNHFQNCVVSPKSNAGYAKKVWTKDEDDILIDKISNLGSNNWNVLATFIPSRTGKQCRERWYNHLVDGGLKKGDWTTEEDSIILSFHNHSGNQWSAISRLLNNRSGNDVKNRFYTLQKLEKRNESNEYNFHVTTHHSSFDNTDESFDKDYLKSFVSALNSKPEPYIKKVWSPEEDATLLNKINSAGLVNWNVIATCIPGRTGKQCRERYHNHLLDGIVKGDWTSEEDNIILSTHLQIGNLWVQISKLLHGRSPNDVKNRCKRLTKHHEFDTADESKMKYGILTIETLPLPSKKRALSSGNCTETESISDYGLQSSPFQNGRESKLIKAESTDLELQEGIVYFSNFLKSLERT